ncbi:hypothetical protein I6I10_12405 [Corynebacterium glucuronolyticum]|uniref:Uncharacterized protein n=1 Tax=Corynebacterium glucuronolyticum TaxID=39791 RepID=A0A7T4EF85_9CORY|nr:hypothetical protein [Corynebacterium glucuronolyticum]QQB46227.1 hypothetical protein I6I10_12405 [Corynebacterium glucuronolyticum]
MAISFRFSTVVGCGSATLDGDFMGTETQAFKGFDQFVFGEEIPFRKREWLLFYPSH